MEAERPEGALFDHARLMIVNGKRLEVLRTARFREVQRWLRERLVRSERGPD